MSRLFARLALIAALVLSQAIYAGHSVAHSDGDQSGCPICVQASAGSAAAVDAGNSLPGPIYIALPAPAQREAAAAPSFTNPHPARAPPAFSPA